MSMKCVIKLILILSRSRATYEGGEFFGEFAHTLLVAERKLPHEFLQCGRELQPVGAKVHGR